jgi:Ankyrin repeat
MRLPTTYAPMAGLDLQLITDVDEFRLVESVLEANLEGVRQYLENGTNVGTLIPGTEHTYCLDVAVSMQNMDMISLLVEFGAESATEQNQHKLYTMCILNDSVQVLNLLLISGALPQETLAAGYLHLIASRGSAPLLRVCLERAVAIGADLSELLALRSISGCTLLHNAVGAETNTIGPFQYRNRAPMVQLLLEYGANVLLVDNNGHTPEDLARLRVVNYVSQWPNEWYVAVHQVLALLETEGVVRRNCVAFAMGHHERLGHGSQIASLDAEVIRMIGEFVSRRHELINP